MLNRAAQSINSLERLKSIEYMFEAFKKVTVSRFKYEQHSVDNTTVYLGSDKSTVTSVRFIIDQPKLVLGLNQNMCRPCVERVFADVKEFFFLTLKLIQILYVLPILNNDLKTIISERRSLAFIKRKISLCMK